jgi:hypothetical protein
MLLVVTTLFVSTTIGVLNEQISIPPGIYSVNKNMFFIFALAGCVYFGISFFISASNERNLYNYAKQLSGVKNMLEMNLSGIRNFESRTKDFVSRSTNSYREIESALLKINMSSFNNIQGQIASGGESAKNFIGDVRRFIDVSLDYYREEPRRSLSKGEVVDFPAQLDNFLLEVQQSISIYEQETTKWLRKIEEDERSLRGFAGLKNDWLEFYFPIIYSITALAVSIVFKLNHWTLSSLFST